MMSIPKRPPECNYVLKAQISPFDLRLWGIPVTLTANSTPLSVFHRHIEPIREAGSCLEQSERSDISFYLRFSLVTPSRFTQIIHPELLWPRPGCSNDIIQLSFYPQAMNNLWIVNQRHGVSSLDWSMALMGPQGPGWRETKQAPFHPLLVQIKIKAPLKGSACAQVIWGPIEQNLGETTSLILIRLLTDRQIKNVFLSQAHPLSISTVTA